MTLTFWQLLSHYFPGIVGAFTLFLYLDLHSTEKLFVLVSQDAETLAVALSIFLVVGAILGIFVDALHHRLVKPLFRRILRKTENTEPFINSEGKRVGDTYFLPLLGAEQFNRVYEAYYYYSEAYINFGLSIFPLVFVGSKYLMGELNYPYSSVWPIQAGLFLFGLLALWSGYTAWVKHLNAFRDAIDGAVYYRNARAEDHPPTK